MTDRQVHVTHPETGKHSLIDISQLESWIAAGWEHLHLEGQPTPQETLAALAAERPADPNTGDGTVYPAAESIPVEVAPGPLAAENADPAPAGEPEPVEPAAEPAEAVVEPVAAEPVAEPTEPVAEPTTEGTPA